jgi:hypothetical protein
VRGFHDRYRDEIISVGMLQQQTLHYLTETQAVAERDRVRLSRGHPPRGSEAMISVKETDSHRHYTQRPRQAREDSHASVENV